MEPTEWQPPSDCPWPFIIGAEGQWQLSVRSEVAYLSRETKWLDVAESAFSSGVAGKSCASRIDREAGCLQKHCVYVSRRCVMMRIRTFTAVTLPEREVNSVFSSEQNISTPAMLLIVQNLFVCLLRVLWFFFSRIPYFLFLLLKNRGCMKPCEVWEEEDYSY